MDDKLRRELSEIKTMLWALGDLVVKRSNGSLTNLKRILEDNYSTDVVDVTLREDAGHGPERKLIGD